MVKKHQQQHGGNEEGGRQSFLSGLVGSFGNKSETQPTTGWFGNSTTNIPRETSSSINVSQGGLTFQKIVSYIAAIILAGTLAVIGFMIYNSKSSMKYPPEVAECPDYWESTGPNKCRNTLKVGTCQDSDEMDFNDPKYSGPTGTVEKCKWANGCGLVWDGLKC
jgi:hypothetical protein